MNDLINKLYYVFQGIIQSIRPCENLLSNKTIIIFLWSHFRSWLSLLMISALFLWLSLLMISSFLVPLLGKINRYRDSKRNETAGLYTLITMGKIQSVVLWLGGAGIRDLRLLVRYFEQVGKLTLPY